MDTSNFRENFISEVIEVCSINSGTNNLEGVTQVGTFFENLFTHLGFLSEWHTPPTECRRAPHLFLKRERKNRPRILILGHLDTVYPKESSFQRAYIDGSKIIGPGSYDMKAGILSAFYALSTLQDVKVIDELSITIALMSDEESNGQPVEMTREPLIKIASEFNVALCLEFNPTLEKIVTKRRGIIKWSIHSKTEGGHSSKISEEHPSAILNMCSFIDKLFRELKSFDNLSFNPSLFLGGQEVSVNSDSGNGQAYGKENIISKAAHCRGDMRFTSRKQLEEVFALIQKKNDKNMFLEFDNDIHPCLEEHSDIQTYLDILKKIQLDIVKSPFSIATPKERGAADSNYISHLLPVIDGLGAIGNFAHTPHKEYIDIDKTLLSCKRLAHFLFQIKDTLNI